MTLLSSVKSGDIVSLASRQKITKKDLEMTDDSGNTALHYAMESGNWVIIKFLLDHGADLLTPNKEQQTPLQLAKPDSIRKMCVETKMRQTDVTLDKSKDDQDHAKNMGLTSTTVRLIEGVSKHTEIIGEKLNSTHEKVESMILKPLKPHSKNSKEDQDLDQDSDHISRSSSNLKLSARNSYFSMSMVDFDCSEYGICNYKGCARKADCVYFPCGHLIFCQIHAASTHCKSCNKKITEMVQIVPTYQTLC